MRIRAVKHREWLAIVVLAFLGAAICRMPEREDFGKAAGLGSGPRATRDLEVSSLLENFQAPPEDCKPMVRWWWFGPAVTTQEINRELHAMKDAGIGGFEVATVYPLTVDDPGKGLVNLRYLSPEHLAAVSFTARAAHDLGLRMDMTMGSGWPFGGPHITPELAAENVRCMHIPIKEGESTLARSLLQEGQRFLAAFVASGDASHFDGESARPIAPQDDGSFQLPLASGGPRVLLYFVAGLTGQQVKRASVGAEGNVFDHYNRAAIEKHLAAVGAPLAEAGGGNIRAMFCDSLEVYGADWTPDFLKEFERRRGYDLTPHLPALFGEGGRQTAALRHDWAQTLTELLNERFLAPYQEWCHQHHVQARVQAYGTPPAQLSSYRYADLPEGEQGDEAGHWNHFTATRWASSAGHMYGVPVISAEAWTWIHTLPFRATPLDFKAFADEYFLSGINQLIGHGWPYSPPGVPEPGWHLYAAGALNPHNPWWFVMPDLALYLQRASFMLRQGRPANDIAVYLPTHDAWADLKPGQTNLWEAIWRKLGPNLLPSLLEAGYNLDFIDDEILADRGRIENGKLKFDNQAYSIVILPGIESIPPATLDKFGEFARGGGILVGTRRLPSRAPGFLHQETESTEVARKVEDLFQKQSAPGHFVASEDQPLEKELNRLYAPDVSFSLRTRDVGFIHRHTDSAEIYFIANTSNRYFDSTATFRASGLAPEWWDLFTGEATAGRALPARGMGTRLPVHLDPYGSRLLVLSNRKAEMPQETIAPELPRRDDLDISRNWSVTFEGTGKKIVMDLLRPWTEVEGLQFYSGRATYERKAYIPGSFLRSGMKTVMSLGEPAPIPVQRAAHYQTWLETPVREAAEVFVNGRRAGSIWHPPYELDIARYIHEGDNELRIVVGNTAVNEMAGSPSPDRTQLTVRYGERFQDQGSYLTKVIPSGLTGPIRLTVRSRPSVVEPVP